jgi:hypothetical protein
LLSSTKLKLATAAALVAAVSAPLLWQQGKISRLRAEKESLETRASELEQLRSENENLRNQSLSPADLQKLHNDRLELQRLRGEVTLLRRQFSLLTNAPAQPEEEKPAPELEPLNVTIRAQVVEMTAARMSELFRELSLPEQRPFPLVLEANKAKELFDLFEKSEGVRLVSTPQVTTADRRDAQVSVTQELKIPNGASEIIGVEIGTFAAIEPDRASVNLQVKVNVTELLGWADEAQTTPKLRTRQAEQEALLRPGQMLLTGSTIAQVEGEDSEPKVQLYCLSPTVINSRGESVQRREELGSTAK